MRKCLDCGAQLKDVDMQCGACGSENISLIENEDKSKEALPKKPKTFIFVIAVFVVIGIIASIFAFNYSSKTVPSEPVEKAINAMYSGDLDTYVNQMYSKFQPDAENFLSDQYGSYSAYEASTKETLINAYGENYKVETKTIDVYPFSSKMVEYLNELCYESGYDVQINKAKNITVRTVTKGEDGNELCYIADEYSAEINGKWYLVPKGLLS